MAEQFSTPKSYKNFFSTTLTQQLNSSGVGDYNVYLADDPVDSEVWLVVEPSATNTREIIRAWRPSGAWAGYVVTNDTNRGLTGANAALTHISGSVVEMRNVAQLHGRQEIFIERLKYGYVEAAGTTGLALKIAPFFGEISSARIAYTGTTHYAGISPVDGSSFTGSDTQTVTNNATNYVELDTSGVIHINQVGWTDAASPRKRLAIVTASGGNITATVDTREFGNTGATGVASLTKTGDSTKLTGDVTLTEGTNVSISRSGNQLIINAATTGTTTSFLQEVPTGTINGANTTFTVSHAPAAAQSLILYVDGIKVPYGAGAGKYTVSGTTITTGTAPATGQTLDCLIMY